jgi:hypothetical protein
MLVPLGWYAGGAWSGLTGMGAIGVWMPGGSARSNPAVTTATGVPQRSTGVTGRRGTARRGTPADRRGGGATGGGRKKEGLARQVRGTHPLPFNYIFQYFTGGPPDLALDTIC